MTPPDAIQEVLPELLQPHADNIEAHAQAIRTLCGDTLPGGMITPLAARAIAANLQTMRAEMDAMCEALRLKITSYDCVQALVREMTAAGIAEHTLRRRLSRRGFDAADMRAAIQTLVEHGDIMRTPDPERPGGKRGPKPYRLTWRKTREGVDQ